MGSYIEDLIKISKSIFVKTDIENLLPVVLDLVLEETGAERCKIVLYGEDGKILFTRGKIKGKEQTENFDTPISKQIVTTVWNAKKTIVSPNAMKDDRFGEKVVEDSIIWQKLLSVACVLLEYKRKPFGVIYIDNREKEAVFDESTGHLLEGLAELLSEALMKSLQNTLEQRREAEFQQQQIQRLREEVDRLRGYGKIIGHSPAMKEVYAFIERVKDRNINILITGESGTGKELVALELHRKSKRSDKPFIKVDCSVISETMFESELFGHEKGAFTGADKPHVGFIEEAGAGTLFFDEIGNISLNVQKKLLQFLDRKVYHRVGSTQERTSEARFIFATNKNIKEMVEKGEFMSDLYFRISEGVERPLPPLRERGNDIILIAEAILKSSRENDRRVSGFSKEVKEWFLNYPFPGNVRELRQIIVRALVNTENDTIQLKDLPQGLLKETSPPEPKNGLMCIQVSDDDSSRIYSQYLPEAYRDKVFIYGIKSGTIDSPHDIRRELHDQLLVSVKNAAEVPLKDAVKALELAFERNYIIEKLIANNGRISESHKQAGVDKTTMIGKIKQHSLRREWYVK